MGLHFIKERAHFIYLLLFGFFKNFIYLFILFTHSFFLFTNVHIYAMYVQCRNKIQRYKLSVSSYNLINWNRY